MIPAILLLALTGGLVPDPPGLPSFLVGDVKHGRDPKPTGLIRIHAQRDGVWKRTEAVDAAEVDWARLLDNDRIEVLALGGAP